MNNLHTLRREFEATNKHLSFPLTFDDREQLIERRNAILKEAQVVAEALNLSGEHWFNTQV